MIGPLGITWAKTAEKWAEDAAKATAPHLSGRDAQHIQLHLSTNDARVKLKLVFHPHTFPFTFT